MADTGMQADVVRARLSQLELLLDDVDRQFSPLQTVQARQSTAMWTDIPACSMFATNYKQTLLDLEQALVAIRANVQVLLVNLALSARDLTATDDGIRERIVALAEQLNSRPVVVPEPVTTTPTDTSSGGYGGTMSGGFDTSTPPGSGPVPV